MPRKGSANEMARWREWASRFMREFKPKPVTVNENESENQMATDTSKTQTQKQDNEFEKVPDSYAEPWKEPKAGDSITGVYIGYKEMEGNNKDTFNSYILQQMDDKLICVAGGTLDGRMTRIPLNTKVRITFQGMQKHGKNMMKMFEIDMAKGTKLLPITHNIKGGKESEDDSNIPF